MAQPATDAMKLTLRVSESVGSPRCSDQTLSVGLSDSLSLADPPTSGTSYHRNPGEEEGMAPLLIPGIPGESETLTV